MTLSWTLTPHSSFEARPELSRQDPWHFWISPRQHYCDRGHWEWGYTGLMDPVLQQYMPSYYFMSIDTALAEVEEFMHRASAGHPAPTATRALPAFDQKGWMAKKSDGSYHTMRASAQGPVMVNIAPHATPYGQVWVADVEGIETLDHSDAFPRVYMFKESALSEMERFLKWRLDNVPFESTHAVVQRSQYKTQSTGQDENLVMGEHLQTLAQALTAPRKKTSVSL